MSAMYAFRSPSRMEPGLDGLILNSTASRRQLCFFLGQGKRFFWGGKGKGKGGGGEGFFEGRREGDSLMFLFDGGVGMFGHGGDPAVDVVGGFGAGEKWGVSFLSLCLCFIPSAFADEYGECTKGNHPAGGGDFSDAIFIIFLIIRRFFSLLPGKYHHRHPTTITVKSINDVKQKGKSKQGKPDPTEKKEKKGKKKKLTEQPVPSPTEYPS